ncbi:MAG: D-tyrosyl-tRNA(Tyr) deacylase [Treponema sp.]|jgi:D-tyrosyl-tRNA(Tyr) deacylase|nr:D-tyrosyl-tRNA(Tyr) deacylase [Treponema sp.]
MKAVVQRVLDASVSVEGAIVGALESGLLVYLGVARDDTEKDAEKLAEKVANLRIFNDVEGKMNISLLNLNAQDQAAGALAVSQFTLLADARKGRRPYYGGAAEPDQARPLYEYFMERIRGLGLPCSGGVFQAAMKVRYTNDGPVTILLDSREFI